MNTKQIVLAGARLSLLPSGVLWWPERGLMAAGDMHLGRAERAARLGGALLPPYETAETLDRLAGEVDRLKPRTVLLLGDSFDDMAAANGLGDESRPAPDAARRRPALDLDRRQPRSGAGRAARQPPGGAGPRGRWSSGMSPTPVSGRLSDGAPAATPSARSARTTTRRRGSACAASRSPAPASWPAGRG